MIRLHQPERFLLAFVALLLFGVGVVAGINVVIDPYDVLRIVHTPWLPNRPAQEGHDRLFKVHLVRSEKPEGIILGTSRAQVMLDPQSPAFGGLHVVNAAVNGSQPYDWVRLYQHANALVPQKLIVVGLDLLAFDAAAKIPATLDEARYAVDSSGAPQRWSAWSDFGSTVLSEDALRSSLSTLRRRHDPSYFTQLGQRDPRFQERDRARAGGPLAYFRASEKDYFGNYSCANPLAIHGEPVEDTRGLRDLARLLELARRGHTRVRLYFSPVHARHLEVIEQAGLLDAQDRWKATIERIVDKERREGLDVVLLDFQGLAFDEAPDAGSWWESSHAKALLGERVLDALLRGDAAAAAWVAGPDRAAAIRTRFLAWEAGHSAEVAEIRAVGAKVLPAARAARGCSTVSHM